MTMNAKMNFNLQKMKLPEELVSLDNYFIEDVKRKIYDLLQSDLYHGIDMKLYAGIKKDLHETN